MEPPRIVQTVDLLNIQGITSDTQVVNRVNAEIPERTSADLNFLREGINDSDVIHLPSQQWYDEITATPSSHAHGLHEIIRNHKRRVIPFYINAETLRWDKMVDVYNDRGTYVDTSNRFRTLAWCRDKVRCCLGMAHLNGPIFVCGNRVTDNDDQKNHEAIAEAMEEVLRKHPETQLILRLMPEKDKAHGQAHERWEAYERLEEEFKEPARVAIDPEKGGLNWLFLQLGSDCALSPSRFEPCGINYLESLHAGCTIIGTAKGALPEAVEEGRNGWIMKDVDATSLVECCSKMIAAFEPPSAWDWEKEVRPYDAPESWQELVCNAMSTPVSWDDAIPRYLKMYCGT